jgi:hypothetical protein
MRHQRQVALFPLCRPRLRTPTHARALPASLPADMRTGWGRAVHKKLIGHPTGPVEMQGSVMVYPIQAFNLTESFAVKVRHCLLPAQPPAQPAPCAAQPPPLPCPVLPSPVLPWPGLSRLRRCSLPVLQPCSNQCPCTPGQQRQPHQRQPCPRLPMHVRRPHPRAPAHSPLRACSPVLILQLGVYRGESLRHVSIAGAPDRATYLDLAVEEARPGATHVRQAPGHS